MTESPRPTGPKPDHLGRTTPLSVEVQTRLAAATMAHQESMHALRTAICNYLDNLHAAGVSRADAIATIRTIVLRSRDGDGGEPNRVLDKILDWCNEFWPIRR